MYSALRDTAATGISMSEAEERLDGNICRCTGYRPITTALHSFCTDSDAGTTHHNKIEGLAEASFEPYEPQAEPPPPMGFLTKAGRPLYFAAGLPEPEAPQERDRDCAFEGSRENAAAEA